MARFFIFYFLFYSCIAFSAYSNIDTIITSSINKGHIPGAQVLISKDSKTIYHKAFGTLSDRAMSSVTSQSIYDLASISKIFTALSVLILHDRGVLKISDPLSRYFVEFDEGDKKDVTIEMLLRHQSGMPAVNYLRDFDEPKFIWEKMKNLSLVRKPGENFIYSDVGFMLLGRLVEELDSSLDTFVEKNILEPLQMTQTSYGDFTINNLDRVAVTTDLDNRGVVHDPRSQKLSGVSGHAGVFSNAFDLNKLISEIANCNGRVLGKEACHLMKTSGNFGRALGLDINSRYIESLRGDYFKVSGGFGHSGYTGTSFYHDKESKSTIIILTNRVFGGDTNESKKAISELRKLIANEVANID